MHTVINKPLDFFFFHGHFCDMFFFSMFSFVRCFPMFQAGGEAIAAVVFGDRAPSGRLPVTIYDEGVIEKRSIGDMDLRSGDGVT